MREPNRVVFDVGANVGDDIGYYLLRADKVVAIEANPALCERLHARFGREIEAGRLVVENCVLSDEPGSREVDFFIHKGFHIWSQLPEPAPAEADQFERRRLPSRYVVDVIEQHGPPHYVKIDVERFDARLLAAIFRAGIKPPYISAECTSFDVPAILYLDGGYRAFKLLDSQSVSRVYRDRCFASPGGADPVKWSFPTHAAGPFGEDIDGPWMTADHVVELIGALGFGWRDLHATSVSEPDTDGGFHHARVSRAVITRLSRVLASRARRLLRRS